MKVKNAETGEFIDPKDHKLTMELIDLLRETYKGWNNVNRLTYTDKQMFQSSMDGVFGFLFAELVYVSDKLRDREKVLPHFIAHCKNLFNQYMDQLEKFKVDEDDE